MSASARRLLVRRLLAEEKVTSQSQLDELLERGGHVVTQATVSRDLDAVGAIKERTATGHRYVVGRATFDGGVLSATFSRFVVGAGSSGNLVVLHTPPAAAHLVASAIDRSGVPGVLGTVAGDDTVIVVADEEIGGSEMASRLVEMGATT